MRIDLFLKFNLYITCAIGIVLQTAFVEARENNHWKRCNNIFASGTTIPFHGTQKRHRFKSKCAPDTLYSWQNFRTFIYDNFKDFETHPFSGYSQLYTWRTPLGTFGYGSSLIRLKLREGVNFKWIKQEERNCKIFPKEETQQTVYVAVLNKGSGMSEYLLCSPKVVESWSKNSLGSKLEALKEINFIRSKYSNGRPLFMKYDAYRGFSVLRRRSNLTYPEINPYFDIVPDPYTDWTTKNLEVAIDRLGKNLDPNDGIIFPEDASDEIKQRHFISREKSYFQLSNDEINSIVRKSTAEYFDK
jgi:hypothetical protein